MDDDTRCELGTAYVKMGRALLRLGNPREAKAMVQKALDVSRASSATERRDVAALYVIADAQAGLGDVATAEARSDVGEERSRLLEEAGTSYEASARTWGQIPNPSAISPGGFLFASRTRRPQAVAGLAREH